MSTTKLAQLTQLPQLPNVLVSQVQPTNPWYQELKEYGQMWGRCPKNNRWLNPIGGSGTAVLAVRQTKVNSISK